MTRLFKTMIVVAVLCAVSQMTFAQKKALRTTTFPSKEVRAARAEAIRDMKRERGGSTNNATLLNPSVSDVGEPDSFGRPMKFMGFSGSGSIYVYYTCDPATLLADLELTLGPDDRCLAAPDPTVFTHAQFTDIARIRIPARTAANIICSVNNHGLYWESFNPTTSVLNGWMSYAPKITIESDALNDPAAINPDTGLPMNGSWTIASGGAKLVGVDILPGTGSVNRDIYSRGMNLGLSRTFLAAQGLPPSVITAFYDKPITIRLGAGVNVKGVGFAAFDFAARWFSD